MKTNQTVMKHAVTGLVVLLVLIGTCYARDFKVALLAPLTGEQAPSAAIVSLWTELAAAVATNVTTEWNNGDNMVVEVRDTASLRYQALIEAAASAADTDVYAVILLGLPAADVFELTRFFRLHNIPCISSTRLTEEDTEHTSDANFFTVHALLENIPTALSAWMSRYQWTRIALIVDDARAELSNESLWGTNSVTTILANPNNMADVFSQVHLGGFTVIAVATSNATLSNQIMANGDAYGLYDAGTAWIIFGRHTDFVPMVGVLYAEYDELPTTNTTKFQEMLDVLPTSGHVIETDSAHLYDALYVAARAMYAVSASPTRSLVRDAIAATNWIGMTGVINFTPGGYREGHPYRMFNGHPNASDDETATHELVYYMMLQTLSLASPNVTVIFPGSLSLPPRTETELYTIAWLIQPGSYSLALDNMSEVMQYAGGAVNGQRNVSYPIPTMPAGTRLRVYTLPVGDTEITLIPTASSLYKFPIMGIISDASSTISELESAILNPFQIIQLSDAATNPSLSDKERHPYFMRSVASDTVQADAIVTFCLSNGWTEVSIISSSDSYGVGLAAQVQSAAYSKGLTIPVMASLSLGDSSYIDDLGSFVAAEPRVVLFLTASEIVARIVLDMKEIGFSPRAIIGSDALTPIMQEPEFYGLTAQDVLGWVGTSPSGGYGESYELFKAEMETLHDWDGVKEYHATAPNWAANLIDTVYVYADAIARCLQNGKNPRNATQLLQAMYQTDRLMLTGQMKFDANGDRIGAYELSNVVPGEGYKVVGRMTEGSIALTQSVIWLDGTTDVPVDVDPRIQKWLKWSDPAGIIFGSLAALGVLMSLGNFFGLVHQRDSPVVRVATWQFLLVMVIGCALGFGSVFTWIGRPAPYICALRIWLPPMAFIMIMAPLLTKTWRLHRIFTLGSLKIKPFPLSHLATLCIGLGVVQIIICIFWISMGTIQPTLINDDNDKKIAYVVCGSNSSNRIAAYVTYGYLGLLMLIGCYLTFRVRNLPKDFNESRWIGFSIYNTLLFSIIIIIVGYALSKFPVTVLILICVCSFAIPTGALAFMVIPKIWILIFHPERRSSSGSRSNNSRTTSKASADNSKNATGMRSRHNYSRQTTKSAGTREEPV